MTENPKNPKDAERQFDSLSQLDRLIDTMKDIRNFLVILIWTMWFVVGVLVAIAINVRGLK